MAAASAAVNTFQTVTQTVSTAEGSGLYSTSWIHWSCSFSTMYKYGISQLTL